MKGLRMSSVEIPDTNDKSSASPSPCPSPVGTLLSSSPLLSTPRLTLTVFLLRASCACLSLSRSSLLPRHANRTSSPSVPLSPSSDAKHVSLREKWMLFLSLTNQISCCSDNISRFHTHTHTYHASCLRHRLQTGIPARMLVPKSPDAHAC